MEINEPLEYKGFEIKKDKMGQCAATGMLGGNKILLLGSKYQRTISQIDLVVKGAQSIH